MSNKNTVTIDKSSIEWEEALDAAWTEGFDAYALSSPEDYPIKNPYKDPSLKHEWCCGFDWAKEEQIKVVPNGSQR